MPLGPIPIRTRKSRVQENRRHWYMRWAEAFIEGEAMTLARTGALPPEQTTALFPGHARQSEWQLLQMADVVQPSLVDLTGRPAALWPIKPEL